MKNFFRKKNNEEVRGFEKIQFDSDFRRTLIELEAKLHSEEATEQIIMDTLVTVCDFYQADWAGILTTDSDTKMWSAVAWFNSKTGAMAKTLFDEDEYFENYPRWVHLSVIAHKDFWW